MLTMQWSELGGPEVLPQIGSGFGTRLIEASARGAGGDAKMAALPGGVQWTFTFKLPAPRQEPAAPKPPQTPSAPLRLWPSLTRAYPGSTGRR